MLELQSHTKKNKKTEKNGARYIPTSPNKNQIGRYIARGRCITGRYIASEAHSGYKLFMVMFLYQIMQAQFVVHLFKLFLYDIEMFPLHYPYCFIVKHNL